MSSASCDWCFKGLIFKGGMNFMLSFMISDSEFLAKEDITGF